MTLSLFMYLGIIQTYFKLLIFRLIRVPNAMFVKNIMVGVNAHDVKVDIRLSTAKPLQVKWILDMFKFLKESKDLFI